MTQLAVICVYLCVLVGLGVASQRAFRGTAQDFFLGCQRAGLAVGVVNAPEEAFEDEHFKARGFQVPVDHEDIGRTVVYPGAPYTLNGSPWAISRRAPKLGEHDDEVFGELAR